MAFIDNSDEFIRKMNQACKQALTSVGMQAVSNTKRNLTEGIPRNESGTSTGALRNSITSEVQMSEQCVIIGSGLKYAIYNEYGTGVYADGGIGKQGYWVYVPGGGGKTGTAKVYTEEKARQIVAILKSKGVDAHMTKGITALHFLKKAIEEHRKEYVDTIKECLEKAK